MPGLLKTPYFRSYWVQRNATQLKPFGSGVIDLFREAREIREERVLIRESRTTGPVEQPVAQVVAWAPTDAGLYRAWAAPPTDQVVDLIRDKLVAPGNSGRTASRVAPIAANPDASAGDASDLETRIDQPPLATDAADIVGPLRPVLEGSLVRAMLQVQSSRPAGDGVFVRNDSAIAMLSANDWPNVILPDVAVYRRGKFLILATSDAMLQRVVARLGTPAVAAGAAYSARYLHARELAPFKRMMTQMDSAESDRTGEGPHFFSQNISSLGGVLNRVESASITVHDDGSRVTQQMLYRLKQ
jgi:hypothetical protein